MDAFFREAKRRENSPALANFLELQGKETEIKQCENALGSVLQGAESVWGVCQEQ
jgi:hypothetical protein